MEPLSPPDTHYVTAAVGWLELGAAGEALAELNCLPEDKRAHPDVLEVYWMIHAFQKAWDKALAEAEALIAVAPERASGWLHRAYALRRTPQGSLKLAWDALLPAFTRFPKEAVIPFNLACYACQMDDLEAARHWLQRATAVGGDKEIRAMALADPDLEPLWAELKQT